MSNLSTVHDAHLSLWQSAVDAAVNGEGPPEKEVDSREPDAQHPAEAATAAVVEAKDPCVDCEAPEVLPPHDPELAELSALHLQVAEAELARNPIDKRIAERLIAELGADTSPGGSIFRTAVGMFKVFAGKLGRPVYRSWKEEGGGDIDFGVIRWRLPANARVALLSDWGTGYRDAIMVLRAACAYEPDAIIHLGDIYFAGTELECRRKFLEPMRRFARRADGSAIPVFSIAGNHDYYSGGGGFHWMLDQMNTGDAAQPASYFALRTEDDRWQFLGMDTGYDSRHDVIHSHRFGALPREDEIEWLHHKLETFPGRTILLSHHQAWSNLSTMGGDADDVEPPFDRLNRRLLDVVEPNREKIALWFWGHEHNLMIYRPFEGILARCIGHSGRPVRVRTVEQEVDWSYAIESVRLSRREGTPWLNHGFEIIDLAELADVRYLEVPASGVPEEIYRERI